MIHSSYGGDNQRGMRIVVSQVRFPHFFVCGIETRCVTWVTKLQSSNLDCPFLSPLAYKSSESWPLWDLSILPLFFFFPRNFLPLKVSIYFFIFHVYEYFACMDIHVPHTCLMPDEEVFLHVVDHRNQTWVFCNRVLNQWVYSLAQCLGS